MMSSLETKVRSTLEKYSVTQVQWRFQDRVSDQNNLLFFKNHSQINYHEIIKDLEKFSFIYFYEPLPPSIYLGVDYQVVGDRDWLKAQQLAMDIIYPYQLEATVIGVTGTNGKTSTAYFLSQLLGLKNNVLLIGTLGAFYNGEKVADFSLTSPSYVDWRKLIYYYGKKLNYFVVEMSSHALEQNRFYGLEIDLAIWTNFTQDHLDYHGTMENYFLAKSKILNQLKDQARVMICENESYLLSRIARTRVHEVTILGEIDEPQFQKQNLSLAFAAAEKLLGQSYIHYLKKLQRVPGRAEFLDVPCEVATDAKIVIDFAHTPAALDNICQSLKKSFPSHVLWVLFGCGGDRDPSKRAIMAKTVAQYADAIYLTSDNPRTENPLEILEQVCQGLSDYQGRVYKEIDRKKSTEQALSQLQDHTILLLAGKGHENYIIIGHTKHPYSDHEVVHGYFSSKGFQGSKSC